MTNMEVIALIIINMEVVVTNIRMIGKFVSLINNLFIL